MVVQHCESNDVELYTYGKNDKCYAQVSESQVQLFVTPWTV